MRQFVGCSRFVWNAILSENNFRYAAGDPLPIGHKSLCTRLLDLKAKYAFLKDAHSQPLQQTLNDLVRAYDRAFDPKLAGAPPAFKKKQNVQAIRFPQGFTLGTKRVKLPTIGWIAFRCSTQTMKRKLEGKITSVTVKRNAGPWYVSFATERDVEAPIHPMMGEVVGVDLGVNCWAALSDGTFISGANALKKYEATKIRRLVPILLWRSASNRFGECQKGRIQRPVFSEQRTHLTILAFRKVTSSI